MTSRFLRLPDHRRRELQVLAKRSHHVVVLAALTGAGTGLLVAGLDRLAVDVLFDHVTELALWPLAFMPLVGLLVGFAARRAVRPAVNASTADEYLHAFHDPSYQLRIRPLAARLVAATAAVGTGAPMWLEGPAVYAGATIGSQLRHRFPRFARDAEHRVLMVAGAAAGVAAIFKAPATGAVFAMEVPYQDDLARRMLLPALVGIASGYLVFAAINGTSLLFSIEGGPGFRFRDLLGACAIGVIAGVGARGFAWMIRRAKRMATNPRPLLTTMAAGLLLAGAFGLARLLTGESLTLGPGYAVVEWVTDPGHSFWLLFAILALRCAATSIAVAGSGAGGLFIPLVAAGALIGAMVADVVATTSADHTLFVVIGVAAFLGAGYRVPLSAVMFVAETTGRPSFVVPGLLAAVAAELVMGRSSVTTYQRSPDDELHHTVTVQPHRHG